MTAHPVWADANVVLRHLTGDPPDLARKALGFMEQAQKGKLLIKLNPIIVAEIVWVLGSYYGYPRVQIAEVMTSLLTAHGIDALDKELMLEALQVMADKNVDFADAVLARTATASAQPVLTFDSDFRKLGCSIHGERERRG